MSQTASFDTITFDFIIRYLILTMLFFIDNSFISDHVLTLHFLLVIQLRSRPLNMQIVCCSFRPWLVGHSNEKFENY